MPDETPTTLPAVVKKERPVIWVPNSFKAMQTMADTILASGLAPQAFKTQAAVIVALQMGAELGLLPMQSLRLIQVIQGKPAPSAAGKVAIVMASGKAEYFYAEEVSPTSSTWVTKRRGAPNPVRFTFTMKQAETAGLPAKNPTYKTYPERMLSARAKSFLADDVYADVVGGLATVEEIQDYDDRPAPMGLVPGVPVAEQLTAEIRSKLDQPKEELAPPGNGHAIPPADETRPLDASRKKCADCGAAHQLPHRMGCPQIAAGTAEPKQTVIPARGPGADDR